jgi:catechol 2,3-dioxygenase-like lactoylglutathione lyase family enzyme
MKITAVAVSSSDLKKTVAFYTLLGFEFSDFADDEQHVEPITSAGSARLMIDSKELIKGIIGEEPKASNHSPFAIEYDSPAEVNQIAAAIEAGGFKVVKQPWDAFWGQRYAIVEDPDGYKVDLYAAL